MNQYDNPGFFAAYAQMARSKFGLEGAGEWHQLEPLFPEQWRGQMLEVMRRPMMLLVKAKKS